jgi:glycosyltransferase involved in cell wall biosynthesis
MDLPEPPAGRTGWPWTAQPAPTPPGEWPRVSVVVPSFNQGMYLEETLRSVLLQGYPDLELIVMDGGSTDQSVDVLQRYDPWITFWVSERDRGQTHAINKGLERATGEIFTYLNSDDLLHPGAIHRVVQEFVGHPSAAVVHGQCVYVDAAGNERFRQLGKVDGFLEYLRIWERFAASDYITQPEAFCRREAVVAVGGFREELQGVMDFDLWLRLLSRGYQFRAIPVPVAHFRTYPTQKSSVDPGHELCRLVEEYVRAPESALPEETQRSLLRELESARAHLLLHAAVAANILGMYPRALRYGLSAAARKPRLLATYDFWSVVVDPAKKWFSQEGRSRVRRLVRRGR